MLWLCFATRLTAVLETYNFFSCTLMYETSAECQVTWFPVTALPVSRGQFRRHHLLMQTFCDIVNFKPDNSFGGECGFDVISYHVTLGHVISRHVISGDIISLSRYFRHRKLETGELFCWRVWLFSILLNVTKNFVHAIEIMTGSTYIPPSV